MQADDTNCLRGPKASDLGGAFTFHREPAGADLAPNPLLGTFSDLHSAITNNATCIHICIYVLVLFTVRDLLKGISSHHIEKTLG